MPRHFSSAQALEKWSKAKTAFSLRVSKNAMEGIFRGPHKGHLKKPEVPVRRRMQRYFSSAQALEKWSEAATALLLRVSKNAIEHIFRGPRKPAAPYWPTALCV
jgi:hypothetical protein